MVAAALAAIAAHPRSAPAQTKTGTALGQFLLIEPSARVAGMGNAGVTLFDGLQSAYYNPAAIGAVRRREAWFDHAAWLADIRYDHAAFALPLGGLGAVYANVTSLGSGEMEVRTVEQPDGTGERFSVSNLAIGVGYGREITDRFSAGLQVRYAQETIWHSAARMVDLGFGTLYRVSPDGLHIGSSISNFGTRARFSGRDLRILYDEDPSRHGDNGTLPGEVFTDAFSVPVLFRVGVGLPYRVSDGAVLHVAVDAFHPSDNTESMSAGAELLVRDALALRAGFRDLFESDAEGGLTLGAGFAASMGAVSYHLDYAWGDYSRLGSVHRISVGASF